MERPLHFIEHIIDEDLNNNYSPSELRFRFPPEPNGYLHIGHVKAICFNFNLGERYQAPVNLRFDDTNPVKEEQQFVDAIKENIEWLGYRWNSECYASDYFQQLYNWALELIDKNLAYVDSQSSEEIAKQKGTPTQSGTESPYRSRTAKENRILFEEMKAGKYKEARGMIVSQARPEEYEEVYKFMYRNLNLWGDTDMKQDQAIVIIRNGIAKSVAVADPEINLAATLVELEMNSL